jgi:hypothetical protein
VTWLLPFVALAVWFVVRRPRTTAPPPELTTLRELVETSRLAHVKLAAERMRVRSLTGEERETARADLEIVEDARREAEAKIERLRVWLTARSFDVSQLRVSTPVEAEEAALLGEARAEVDRELGA